VTSSAGTRQEVPFFVDISSCPESPEIMSVQSHSHPLGASDRKLDEKHALDPELLQGHDVQYDDAEDILARQDIDPALNAKMHIVNNVRFLNCQIWGIVLIRCQAIDSIGWTNYHWKLFFLNGFG
jgi:hypothetical protein